MVYKQSLTLYVLLHFLMYNSIIVFFTKAMHIVITMHTSSRIIIVHLYKIQNPDGKCLLHYSIYPLILAPSVLQMRYKSTKCLRNDNFMHTLNY